MKRVELLIIIIAIVIITILGILINLYSNKTNEITQNIENKHVEKIVRETTKKDYNSFIYQFISYESMLTTYLNNYKDLLLNSPKEAYGLLDKEYKEKRFPTFEQFNNYIKQNKNYLETIQLNSYSRANYDDYYEYTLRDQYGNVYIIKETAILEYTVQLDDYTIENEALTKTYNASTDKDKAKLNCDKFFEMINTQDYTSAYNVLDEKFKNTNFKTQQDFENYIKSKLYTHNKATYQEYNNTIPNIHQYKITLTDATQTTPQDQRQINIIMKLQEATTNFTMSFNIT